MAMKTLLQPAIGSIKSTLAQMKAKSFHACPVAMRHAPLPEKEYVEVLVDSGMQGRMFRALVNLTESPISTLRITNVSGFQKSERNMFAAFAEALEYRVVDKIKGTVPYYIGNGIGDSEFAIKRRGRIENLNAYYYLAPFHETDVVLAPEACDCCFDFAHLDYMRSCFDLTGMGTMLFIRFLPSLVATYLKSPLVGWMERAGFEAHWFLGADNIKGWECQSAAGQGFSLEGISRLIVLGKKMKAETHALSQAWRYIPHDNYLVFQRGSFSSISVMQTLFSEIMGWEEAHIEQRLTETPSRIKRAQRFLADFEQRLPALLSAYCSAE